MIRKAYCGDGAVPNETDVEKYHRHGSRRECLTKGIGLGLSQERSKNLHRESLQTIHYVGPVLEEVFRGLGVRTLSTLRRAVGRIEPVGARRTFIERGCTKRNGVVDQRAVNAVFVYLHDHGIAMPACNIIYE
jgi:hypothetical protein